MFVGLFTIAAAAAFIAILGSFIERTYTFYTLAILALIVTCILYPFATQQIDETIQVTKLKEAQFEQACKDHGGDYVGYSRDATTDVCYSSKTNNRIIIPNL